MIRLVTFGSTCRTAIGNGCRPAARAASTYSVRITWSAPLRITRAKLGTEAMPMAIIAVSVLAPNTAPNMMASSNAGNASSRSFVRMTNSEVHRRDIAARIPSGTPITAATPTATTPTNSVVRDPTMIWLNTSRPNLSVPNQCSHEGFSNRDGRVDERRVVRRPDERHQRHQHDDPDDHAAGDQTRIQSPHRAPVRSRGSSATYSRSTTKLTSSTATTRTITTSWTSSRSRFDTPSSNRLRAPG